MNILLIVASGKSSRFGGFPKAFCKIGNITNAENTALKAKKIVDKVYIGVNNVTYEQFHDHVSECEMFKIITGQGDAHSLLKCLKYIKEKEPNVDSILVCWGDAVFTSSLPFVEIIKACGDVIVACSKDPKPYAWFDVDENNNIIKAHFSKEEGERDFGIHDQSLFKFNIDFAISYLNDYRLYLNIPSENDENLSDINEMKLLHSFEYLFNRGQSAKCFQITKNNVISFNTKEELEKIKEYLDVNNNSRGGK